MQSIEELITAAKERRAASEADASAEKERRGQEEGEQQRTLIVRLYGSLVEVLDMQIDSGGAMFEFRSRTYHLYEMHNGSWQLVRYAEEEAHLLPSLYLTPTRTSLAGNCDELLLALDALSAQPDVPSVEIPYSPRAMTAREERFLDALRGFIQDTM